MLQLSGAGKRFDQKLLFEDFNWLITPDERTALVAGNGTGKSTLLKILGGIESLGYGQLTRVKAMASAELDGTPYGNEDCPAELDHPWPLVELLVW